MHAPAPGPPARRPVLGLLLAAALVNLPLVHGTLTGQELGAVVVIALVADAALVVAAALAWRFGGPAAVGGAQEGTGPGERGGPAGPGG